MSAAVAPQYLSQTEDVTVADLGSDSLMDCAGLAAGRKKKKTKTTPFTDYTQRWKAKQDAVMSRQHGDCARLFEYISNGHLHTFHAKLLSVSCK